MRRRLAVAAAWLAVWYLADRWIGNDILFAGPAETAAALLRLGRTSEFWNSIGSSLVRILGGCLAGGILGILTAALASGIRWLDLFLEPFVSVLKAVPVVSFIILVLIWAGNRWVSFVVCAVIVYPILYFNTRSGIASADAGMREMAEVYRMTLPARLRLIYWPACRTHLLSAVSVAAGMGLKGGVSAEVIGQPLHTIGNSLYRAKIVLATDEVFAWSAVTILLSVLLTSGLQYLIRRAGGSGKGGRG